MTKVDVSLKDIEALEKAFVESKLNSFNDKGFKLSRKIGSKRRGFAGDYQDQLNQSFWVFKETNQDGSEPSYNVYMRVKKGQDKGCLGQGSYGRVYKVVRVGSIDDHHKFSPCGELSPPGVGKRQVYSGHINQFYALKREYADDYGEFTLQKEQDMYKKRGGIPTALIQRARSRSFLSAQYLLTPLRTMNINDVTDLQLKSCLPLLILLELDKWHKEDIAFIDLKPEHIFVDPKTWAIYFIDPGLSARLDSTVERYMDKIDVSVTGDHNIAPEYWCRQVLSRGDEHFYQYLYMDVKDSEYKNLTIENDWLFKPTIAGDLYSFGWVLSCMEYDIFQKNNTIIQLTKLFPDKRPTKDQVIAQLIDDPDLLQMLKEDDDGFKRKFYQAIGTKYLMLMKLKDEIKCHINKLMEGKGKSELSDEKIEILNKKIAILRDLINPDKDYDGNTTSLHQRRGSGDHFLNVAKIFLTLGLILARRYIQEGAKQDLQGKTGLQKFGLLASPPLPKSARLAKEYQAAVAAAA